VKCACVSVQLLMCSAFSFMVCLVHEFSGSFADLLSLALVTCRHLVWEDGCCGHASCSAGSEAPEEAGCEPGTSVCTLVKKVMASQIHVVGEG